MWRGLLCWWWWKGNERTVIESSNKKWDMSLSKVACFGSCSHCVSGSKLAPALPAPQLLSQGSIAAVALDFFATPKPRSLEAM
jgi:hypothetical protein